MTIQESVAASQQHVQPKSQPHLPAANSKVAYTVRDLLAVLRVSRPTVYKILRSGELPSSKVGARRLVTHENLKRYLKSKETA